MFLVVPSSPATAAFAPNDAAGVFIFLISVSHFPYLAALPPACGAGMGKSRRALAFADRGCGIVSSLAVMVSRYQLEAAHCRSR